MTKIIFLDIDGPMIPGRAYMLPKQTKIVTVFDPVAVSMLNTLCKERGWKIVVHSSWVRIMGGQETVDHCVTQGLLAEHFHEDAYCDENENWRYTRVAKWLKNHPEVEKYVILDDEPYKADVFSNYPHPEELKNHLILVDFEDGLLTKEFKKIRDGNWKVKPQTDSVIDYANV